MTISDIKDLIKNRRVELGLTLKDVAQAVGVSEGTVSRWESGNITNMKRNKIAALAKVLRISPTIIMGWNESVVSEDNSCYYLNPEAAKMAQEIYDNPQYKHELAGALHTQQLQQLTQRIGIRRCVEIKHHLWIDAAALQQAQRFAALRAAWVMVNCYRVGHGVSLHFLIGAEAGLQIA